MLQFARHPSVSALGAACALGVLALSAPASGQEARPSFIIVAHGERSLSAPVDLTGLDLTTRSGQTGLRHRVWKVAAELCGQLGDTDAAVGMAFSCIDDAVMSAAPSQRAANAQAMAQAKAAQQPVLASAGPR